MRLRKNRQTIGPTIRRTIWWKTPLKIRQKCGAGIARHFLSKSHAQARRETFMHGLHYCETASAFIRFAAFYFSMLKTQVSKIMSVSETSFPQTMAYFVEFFCFFSAFFFTLIFYHIFLISGWSMVEF